MFNMSDEHLAAVKLILKKHGHGVEVRVFGSRVSDKCKNYSDLDLALVSRNKIPRERLIELKEAFQESDLPFRVDVMDWNRLTPEFQKIIARKYVVL
jgi:predicted nucleotidyltransferase